MAVSLEKVKLFTIWTRTLGTMLLAILYSFLVGFTTISIVGLSLALLKLIETSLLQQFKPSQRNERNKLLEEAKEFMVKVTDDYWDSVPHDLHDWAYSWRGRYSQHVGRKVGSSR